MFIGLKTCFFYVVVANYVISGCHATSYSSSTGLNIMRGTRDQFTNLQCATKASQELSCNCSKQLGECVDVECSQCQCNRNQTFLLELNSEYGSCKKNFVLRSIHGCSSYSDGSSVVLINITQLELCNKTGKQCIVEKTLKTTVNNTNKQCSIQWNKTMFLNYTSWDDLLKRDVFADVLINESKLILKINLTKTSEILYNKVVKLRINCGETPDNKKSTACVFVKFPYVSIATVTQLPLATKTKHGETATFSAEYPTVSSKTEPMNSSKDLTSKLEITPAFSTKEVSSPPADTVTANEVSTHLELDEIEKTSSPNTDVLESSTRMSTATYSNPTKQSTSPGEIPKQAIKVSTTDSDVKAISSSIASTSSASKTTKQTTFTSINKTVNSSTKVSSITEMPKPSNMASTRSSKMATPSKAPACPGSIAKQATFPTEYKAILIVCLVVVLILLVGCIIERKRCCNVENSKETRSGDDIEVIPLTMECTTSTAATNPMYSFGDCIDQKEAPETNTVDQEPGSKSDTKQADGTHVIEIELHPQSQNQKNTGDHATSSDVVDNIAQPSTSKAEDGRGDSDKDSGKDGGESGTSKPEVASKSECAPKEADVKQVEPSTKPAKDELGPQSQGDTPDNKSDGVQDVVQRSSLSAEVAEAVMKGVDNKNGKDGVEEVSGKPEADAKSECEPAHKTDVEQVNNSTQDVSEDGQQPQLREINLGDISIKEMKLF